MKIAVCLFGHAFRYLTTNYPNHEIYKIPIEQKYNVDGLNFLSLKSWDQNIIGHNEIDFFIHSWNTQEHHKSKLIEIFSPKSYCFEHSDPKMRVSGQFMSRYKSVLLLDEWEKKNSYEYDLVIVTRPDLVWFRPIKFHEILDPQKLTLLNWTNPPSIYGTSRNNMHQKEYLPGRYGSFDVFLSSSSSDIKKLVSQIYSDGVYIDEESLDKNLKDYHTLLRHHIEKSDLLEKLDYKLDWYNDAQIEYLLYIFFNPYDNQWGNPFYREYLYSFLPEEFVSEFHTRLYSPNRLTISKLSPYKKLKIR
jgi:hypothetical protein